MFFNTLKLNDRLLRGIAARGYTEATPVQEQTLTKTLEGFDAAVQSQTGTGKTAAFLITLFQRMLQERPAIRKRALIIVPTRELAAQIEEEAVLLNRYIGFKIGSFYGGVGYGPQLKMLKTGVDIMIGTPGRLLDLSQRGVLKLGDTGFLVIDEADRLFDMGFLPDLRNLLRKMPPPHARQSMLFSATLDRISRGIAAEYLNHPSIIELTPEQVTVETISQELYRVKSHIKDNLLLGILQKSAPRNALIFTNMRHAAFKLAKKLKLNGYHSHYLTGDLTQMERSKVLEEFKEGRFPFLVATDVAARGLHIDGLEMVINYDLPQDCENYIHRIGRTARAGNSGRAVSLACEKFSKHLEAIESYIGMQIPIKTFGSELFATDRSLEFMARKKGQPRRHQKNGFKNGPSKHRPRHRTL
ncbi:MAG: DEAD/DEAH box helicase [Candidatus Aminicenantales bacterium]